MQLPVLEMDRKCLILLLITYLLQITQHSQSLSIVNTQYTHIYVVHILWIRCFNWTKYLVIISNMKNKEEQQTCLLIFRKSHCSKRMFETIKNCNLNHLIWHCHLNNNNNNTYVLCIFDIRTRCAYCALCISKMFSKSCWRKRITKKWRKRNI